MPARPLQPHEAEDLADLLGLVEDWLLHAEPETLDDLSSFLTNPSDRGQWVIDSLGQAAVRLRQQTNHPRRQPPGLV